MCSSDRTKERHLYSGTTMASTPLATAERIEKDKPTLSNIQGYSGSILNSPSSQVPSL